MTEFAVKQVIPHLHVPYAREVLVRRFDSETRKLERYALDKGMAPDWTKFTARIGKGLMLDEYEDRWLTPGMLPMRLSVIGGAL